MNQIIRTEGRDVELRLDVDQLREILTAFDIASMGDTVAARWVRAAVELIEKTPRT